MSKRKTRTPNISAEVLERARAEARGELAPVVKTTKAGSTRPHITSVAPMGSAAAVVNTRRNPSLEDLQREYSYVIRDLRKLFIVAISLLVVIVILAILLPPIGA